MRRGRGNEVEECRKGRGGGGPGEEVREKMEKKEGKIKEKELKSKNGSFTFISSFH